MGKPNSATYFLNMILENAKKAVQEKNGQYDVPINPRSWFSPKIGIADDGTRILFMGLDTQPQEIKDKVWNMLNCRLLREPYRAWLYEGIKICIDSCPADFEGFQISVTSYHQFKKQGFSL